MLVTHALMGFGKDHRPTPKGSSVRLKVAQALPCEYEKKNKNKNKTNAYDSRNLCEKKPARRQGIHMQYMDGFPGTTLYSIESKYMRQPVDARV